LKNAHLSSNSYNYFECNQILQWNLQDSPRPESSSVNIINLAKNLLKFQRYWIFPVRLLFGAPLSVHGVVIRLLAFLTMMLESFESSLVESFESFVCAELPKRTYFICRTEQQQLPVTKLLTAHLKPITHRRRDATWRRRCVLGLRTDLSVYT